MLDGWHGWISCAQGAGGRPIRDCGTVAGTDDAAHRAWTRAFRWPRTASRRYARHAQESDARTERIRACSGSRAPPGDLIGFVLGELQTRPPKTMPGVYGFISDMYVQRGVAAARASEAPCSRRCVCGAPRTRLPPWNCTWPKTTPPPSRSGRAWACNRSLNWYTWICRTRRGGIQPPLRLHIP